MAREGPSATGRSYVTTSRESPSLLFGGWLAVEVLSESLASFTKKPVVSSRLDL